MVRPPSVWRSIACARRFHSTLFNNVEHGTELPPTQAGGFMQG
jgi:hypothetical protein